MALFGTLKGIVQLNLGTISTFQVRGRGANGGHGPLRQMASAASRLPAVRCTRLLCACPCALPPLQLSCPRLATHPWAVLQEVVVSFHKAPKYWWDACTSKKGKENLFKWVQ